MSTGWRPKPPTPTAPVTAVAATVMSATRRGGGGGDGPDRRGGGSGGTTTEATAIVAVVVETGAACARRTAARGEVTAGLPEANRAAITRKNGRVTTPRAHPPTLRRGGIFGAPPHDSGFGWRGFRLFRLRSRRFSYSGFSSG